ncbi:hypothetical protein MTO96_041446, partial [Rhipicephalus appendiculatus]
MARVEVQKLSDELMLLGASDDLEPDIEDRIMKER